jgi:hypothetical protein
MKFSKIRPFKGRGAEDAVRYLTRDLAKGISDLFAGLSKLSLVDNFDGFLVENVTIAAGTEKAIAIPGSFNGRPTGFQVVRLSGVDMPIVDGDSVWTDSVVYVKNPDSTDAVATIFFMKV